jgi:hypothetical protein
MKQDNDDTDQEIRNIDSEDPGVSTLSSNMKEDDLDNRQEVQHLNKVRHNTTIQSTRVPLPK